MTEEPEYQEILSQVKKMIPKNELKLMSNRIKRDPLTPRFAECVRNGKYVIEFRDHYCGLNFIYQRTPRCPFLELDGPFFDLETPNGIRYRVHHCLRQSVKLEGLIDGGD